MESGNRVGGQALAAFLLLGDPPQSRHAASRAMALDVRNALGGNSSMVACRGFMTQGYQGNPRGSE